MDESDSAPTRRDAQASWSDPDANRALAEHETYMRQLASRIWRLDHQQTHWWIREIRRHQATCDWCERCDGAVAA